MQRHLNRHVKPNLMDERHVNLYSKKEREVPCRLPEGETALVQHLHDYNDYP